MQLGGPFYALRSRMGNRNACLPKFGFPDETEDSFEVTTGCSAARFSEQNRVTLTH